MKLIVDENLLSFKVLEQKIFDYVCELGRQITQQILEAYDTELAESRDKKHYRGKGKRKTCIKTVYGEVEYKRTVYRTKTEQGENAYVYLLDEAMQMNKIGLISTNLAEKIAMTVTESPYRVTAETISTTCGQTISSSGVWNMMQRLGERIDEEEQYAVKEMHADRTQGEKIIPVLFEEMDGIWLHMQDSSHKRMKKQEMKVFRYMDDDFMTACLEDNYEAVELILRIVLGQEDITIKSIRVQDSMKNLQGRSAILDVHAVDNTGKEFDCEIQRSDKGAGVKRARHNSSLLDAHILKPGEDTENIPDTYVIFITENDVMKGKQPIYPVERYITIGEEKVLFGDGSHILYVNGKYRGDGEVGKLMHDFSCTDPDDMNYEILAKKARYFKQDEKGVATMCKLMEDMRSEAAHDKVKEKAILMLKNGKISFDEISVFFSELSDEEIEEIKSKIMQLA